MVYIVLCSHAKKDGPAFPSVKTIAQEASCSRTKVFEALNTLEERGIITRENQIFPKRGQTSNLYEIIDIEPRPQSGGGGQGRNTSPSPSIIRTGESAARTGGVPVADAPLDVLEQDHLNMTKELKDPPIPPEGKNTEIPQPKLKEPEGQEPRTQEQEPKIQEQEPTKEPEPMTQPEEEKRPETKPAADTPGFIEVILAAYNRILPELPSAGGVTSSRGRAVRRRIKEDGERSDPSWWERYFSLVREFPWLMGNNPSGWRACLDWLIGERGMLKVLEGGFGRSSPDEPRDGAELQKKYTGANGVVDVKSLLRDLETA
jgi:hypothetical protein